MKIIGNTLETIHKFRHGHVSQHWLNDPFLTSTTSLGANRNIKLQLLYLDINDTFYLVESTSAMSHSLQYQDGAIIISDWSPADFAGLLRSYNKPGFDNYFQLIVTNTALAYSNS